MYVVPPEDQNARLEQLNAQLDNLQQKFDSQREDFNARIEQTKEQARKDLEEQKSSLQHTINKDVNTKISKYDDIKCSSETYKYKSSQTALKRIYEVRSKIQEAQTEGERDFEDFSQTRTGRLLVEAQEILDDQEGFVRLAESSKFGYKLVDKVNTQDTTYALIKDPEKVRRIKAAEKELEKEYEATSKKRPRHRTGRDRSRSRSRSPSPRKKKVSSATSHRYTDNMLLLTGGTTPVTGVTGQDTHSHSKYNSTNYTCLLYTSPSPRD